MPTILLSIFRNPYAIGVLAVLLVGGIQQGRIWKAQNSLLNCESEITQLQDRWQEAQAEGQKAAREALEAAIRREREESARLLQQQQEAAQRAREAARDARAETEAWQRRYREALRDDPGCEAWANQPVACPVR
jgi:hypothetical protein